MMSNIPPSLTEAEQNQLLKKLPDRKARDTLINTNLRLVLYIAKKYTTSTYVSEEDLMSIGTIGLIKAIDSYSFEKDTKLATYAFRCIDNEIKMYMRKEKKYLGQVSIDEPICIDGSGNEMLLSEILPDTKSNFVESIENIDIFFKIINVISNRLYKESYRNLIIFLYMLGGRKQRDIAKTMGITQSWVGRLFKKFKTQCVSCNADSEENDSDVYFFKDEDNYLCLKLKGTPLIRKTLELESFAEIAEFIFKSN